MAEQISAVEITASLIAQSLTDDELLGVANAGGLGIDPRGHEWYGKAKALFSANGSMGQDSLRAVRRIVSQRFAKA